VSSVGFDLKMIMRFCDENRPRPSGEEGEKVGTETRTTKRCLP